MRKAVKALMAHDRCTT